jgi:alpha-1,2-mannosyltransferase
VQAFIYSLQLIVTLSGVIAIYLIARNWTPPRHPTSLWMLSALTGGLVALLAFKGSSPPHRFHDFVTAYYPAGQAIAHHEQAELRALLGKGVSGFVNIPVIAYLFAPFGWLPPEIAIALFTVIGIAFTVASWFLLVRLAKLELRERWLLALLFVTNGPLINAVKLGNTSYLVLFALAGGLVLLRRRQPVYAGALLGAAAMIKPPLLLFGAFFALRRDLRGTLSFAAVCAATVALSLIIFGVDDNLYWFDTSIIQYSHSWVAAFNVQSISGFFLRLHLDAELTDWLPHHPTSADKLVVHILTALLFIIAGVACVERPAQADVRPEIDASERRDLQYLLVICLCLVSSPLTWSHYYVWLLVPIAFFLGTQPPFPSSGTARGVGWAAVALVMPLVEWPWSISNRALMHAYTSFTVSHFLFGGLLWFGLIAWWLAKSSGLLSSSPSHHDVTYELEGR